MRASWLCPPCRTDRRAPLAKRRGPAARPRTSSCLMPCLWFSQSYAYKRKTAPERGFSLPAVRGCPTSGTGPTAGEEVDDGEQHHRTQQRDQERANAQARIDGADADQRGDEPARQQGADDADHDVEEDALGGIALHDDAGEPTNDAADYQPNDKVHNNTPGG